MSLLRRWLIKKLKPEVYQRFHWELERDMPVKEACFVVFDTETTGLDLKKDEPVSIGALKIRGLKIHLSESFYQLLKPQRTLKESIKVHGITLEDLQVAKEGRQVCEEFISYAWGCVLVGYFVHIDVSMLRNLTKKACGGAFYPYAVDVLDLIKPLNNIPTLEELLKEHRLPVSKAHNALEDAYMTALLFLKLVKEGRYKRLMDLPVRVY